MGGDQPRISIYKGDTFVRECAIEDYQIESFQKLLSPLGTLTRFFGHFADGALQTPTTEGCVVRVQFKSTARITKQIKGQPSEVVSFEDLMSYVASDAKGAGPRVGFSLKATLQAHKRSLIVCSVLDLQQDETQPCQGVHWIFFGKWLLTKASRESLTGLTVSVNRGEFNEYQCQTAEVCEMVRRVVALGAGGPYDE